MAAPHPLNQFPTLSALLRESTLTEALSRVDQGLRRKPDLAGHLLRLDLLCLLGDWARAAKQGETCTRFDASCLPLMALVHALTACETQREAVFAGTAEPALPPDAPQWLTLQHRALQAQARGNTDLADTLREEALSQAPESPGCGEGTAGETPFQWIADSDTRLGPVLEVFTQDQYLWLPFCALEELEIARPDALRDFVWLPVMFATAGQRRHGFLPARYPGSVAAGDAFAAGRETCWHNVGDTGVFGVGQKVLTTDSADLPVFDLRRVRLGATA